MKSLDDHLEAALAEGAPGVVVLAADGSSTWQKAAGLADLSTGTPMTPGHRFRIASVTKLFTSAVVLQLVDEGALALDAEVGSIEGGVTVGSCSTTRAGSRTSPRSTRCSRRIERTEHTAPG